ncbi:MAG: NAD(P)-binding domain-containing protein [Thermoproteus sp. AZ2]|jgi:glutamyl-tRNA reductase|uniref:NAD(P)-binding domain-containing protein n=1 Tax=Thermoproteus sp. AZ2 TaxID=1609232 RepID=A0ACC6V1A1_9CREN
MASLDKLFSASITFRDVSTDKLGELGRGVMELVGVAPYFPKPLFALHTCNRVEVYAWDVPQHVVDAILSAYREFADRVTIRRGAEAALHLLEVAAGLDSMLIGETDILGQLEEAFDEQVKKHITREPLRTIIERAIRFGKAARTHTGISRGPRGLGSLSIIYVKEHFGELSAMKIGVIGAGSVGQGLVKELKDAGASEIYVLNRTFEKASEVAAKYGARAMPLNEASVEECLKTCDVVFATAASFEPIIRSVPEGARVKAVVDLGVPGNVAPGLPVKVVRLSDLEEIAARYNKERAREVERVRAMAVAELEAVEKAVARRLVEAEIGEYMAYVQGILGEGASADVAVKKAVLPLVEALQALAERGMLEEALEVVREARRRVRPREKTSTP